MLIDHGRFCFSIFLVFSVSRTTDSKHGVDIVILGVVEMFLDRVVIIATQLYDRLVFIMFFELLLDFSLKRFRQRIKPIR